MKVIILAGGWGTRLGQITDIIPKPMVQIGDKPILWHIMKTYSHFGFNDFIICLGVKGEVIKNYFNHYQFINCDFTMDLKTGKKTYHTDHTEKDWKVTCVSTGLNTLKGARIKKIENYLDDDINMLTYGDGIADININELVKFHKSHGKTLTLTGVHPSERFGQITEEDGRLISFFEKPKQSKHLINGGFMIFNKDILKHLTTDEDCDFEFGPVEDLAKKGEVMVYKHEKNWECMDHERDVKYLNDLWNSNKAFWKVWK